MNRLYVLINVKPGKVEEVAQIVQNKPGVLFADIIDSPPDIIMVVHASDKQKLAELTLNALTPAEHLIKEVQLLPAQDKKITLATALTFRRN